MNGYRIRGVVEGSVHFPDAPDHVGHGGLVGGEDVQAQRRTFRSPTEAARWCERVLAGTVLPRWTSYGPLNRRYEGPSWQSAWVVAEDGYGNTIKRWEYHRHEWMEAP